MKDTLDHQVIDEGKLVEYTVSIVLSYIENNNVLIDDLVALIYDVHRAVSDVNTKQEAAAHRFVPAVPIEESVQPDYIICLEDGKKMKMLKKHLKSAHNMTLDEYRRKWGLPSDYPMVASEYASRRSNLARAIGLGKGKLRK